MLRIEDLFTSEEHREAPQPADRDPLREPDALFDAQLLDARVCPTANRAALLFDTRTAEWFPDGNAALLVVHGLKSFQ
ncbi:hypothetical protein E5083_12545 [Streptomyces bauhiniae]|uniref:Uncharacterized protein n=1 Tax=Streptomyces bauhiniae TaxID=2340725 RepID=A0A4Z1D910_9ACTN|nr:hypothetical protein [Streptomyces bauhiniae]TGN78024.1 hypothetical protein E5083_12545 [Streptomyces bauhiniae]